MNIYLDLFLTFAKLGVTTFGGGYAMIANIRETVIEKKNWMDEDELLEVCAIAESTPGPIAINLATYIGYKKGKVLGSVLSTLGVVLPSLILIFIISLFLDKVLDNKYVEYAFKGINVCVAFLILKAGVSMFIKMKKNLWRILLFLTVFILMIVFEILTISFSSIYFILIGGLISIIILNIQKEVN